MDTRDQNASPSNPDPAMMQSTSPVDPATTKATAELEPGHVESGSADKHRASNVIALSPSLTLTLADGALTISGMHQVHNLNTPPWVGSGQLTPFLPLLRRRQGHGQSFQERPSKLWDWSARYDSSTFLLLAQLTEHLLTCDGILQHVAGPGRPSTFTTSSGPRLLRTASICV